MSKTVEEDLQLTVVGGVETLGGAVDVDVCDADLHSVHLHPGAPAHQRLARQPQTIPSLGLPSDKGFKGEKAETTSAGGPA